MNTMRNTKNAGLTIVISAIVAIAIATFSMLPVGMAQAVDCIANPTAEGCPCSGGVASSSSSAACKEMDPSKNGSDLTKTAKNYINAAFYVIGVLSAIMIAYSGIRYITAHGNKTQVESAKNILIYSIVGLVVALSAFAITNFVLSRF